MILIIQLGVSTMRKKLKIVSKLILCSGVLLAAIAVTFSGLSETASATDNELIQNALYSALWTCYGGSGGVARAYLKENINSEEYNNHFYPDWAVDDTTKVITLPGWYSSGGSENKLAISCKDVFKGGTLRNTSVGSYAGLQDNNGQGYDPVNWGYAVDEGASTAERKCIYATYNYKSNGSWVEDTSNGLCFPVDSSGNLRFEEGNGGINYTYMDGTMDNPGAGKLVLGVDSSMGYVTIGYCEPFSGGCTSMYSSRAQICSIFSGLDNSCGPTWTNLKNQIGHKAWGYDFNSCDSSDDADMYADNTCVGYHTGAGEPFDYPVQYIEFHDKDDGSTIASSYHLTASSGARALEFLTGTQRFAKFEFDDTYLAKLYTSYFNDMNDKYSGTLTPNNLKCSTNKNDYTYAVTSDGINWCEVASGAVTQVSEKFAIKDTSRTLKIGSFADVMSQLKNLDMTKVDSGALNPTDPNEPSVLDPSGEAGVPICTEVTGVVSWVFCSVLNVAGNAVGMIYDWIEGSFLEIKGGFMDRDSGTYKGWKVFRDLANIAFVIAFIVVILAQVTGIGMTNYNIKKTLPRLIMVAVLVNLSFLICQLAVDLSNIVGSQLNSLLRGLVTVGEDESFNMSHVSSLTQVLVEGGSFLTTGAIGIAAGALAIANWHVWLPALALTIVGAIIGVLFFFITLALRQAGVLLAVVVAPIAIVCYALPNTKSIFDKWRKLFTALLLVYPICGLLMGGGTFAANLMTSNLSSVPALDRFMYIIVAMLLNIVPFFFIPSILRNSLNGLGMLGMKLQNFGRGMQMRGKHALGSSRRFQDFSMEAKRRGDERWNTRVMNSRAGRRVNRLSELNRQIEAAGGTAADHTVNGARRFLGTNAAAEYARLMRTNSRDTRRLGRAAMSSQRMLQEEAMSEAAIADGFYGHSDPRYRGRVEDAKNMNVMREAKAISTTMASDGTINDTRGTIVPMLEQAMSDLQADSSNQAARARFLAAKQELMKTDDGRKYFESTINRFAYDASDAGLSIDKRRTANRALRWMAGMTSDADGNMLKTVAPSLSNAIKNFADVKDGDFAVNQANIHTSTETIDGSTVTFYENDDDFIRQAGSISAARVPGLDEREAKRALRLLNSGAIAGPDAARLRSAFQKAITSKQTRDQIKPKDMQLFQQIANSEYMAHDADGNMLPHTDFADVTESQVNAMASASGEEIDRIADGMKNGYITGGEQQELLKTMEQTMVQAVAHPDQVKIAPETATKMHKILAANGVDVVSDIQTKMATHMGPQPAAMANFKDSYGTLMGMKIDHTPPRLTLADKRKSDGWRQVSIDDLNGRYKQTFSHFKEGDWVKRVYEVNSSGQQIPKFVKMTPGEIKEAERLQAMDIEEKIRGGAGS